MVHLSCMLGCDGSCIVCRANRPTNGVATVRGEKRRQTRKLSTRVCAGENHRTCNAGVNNGKGAWNAFAAIVALQTKNDKNVSTCVNSFVSCTEAILPNLACQLISFLTSCRGLADSPCPSFWRIYGDCRALVKLPCYGHIQHGREMRDPAKNPVTWRCGWVYSRSK